MPVQFIIKFNQENKNDRISKKEIKQALFQFKQVYKLLENFNKSNLSEKKGSVGPNKRIYITDKGREFNYKYEFNEHQSSIRLPIKARKTKQEVIDDKNLIHNSGDKLSLNKRPASKQRAAKIVNVKNFEEPNSVGDLVMPLSHLGRKTEDGTKFSLGGKNLWIMKPIGYNRGKGIHVVSSIKQVKRLITQYT